MAKLILGLMFSILLVPCVGGSAQISSEPDNFRGMKWGITLGETKRMIQEQWTKRRESGEIIVYTELSERYVDERSWSLLYRDKIGAVPVGIVLYFLDDRFVSAILSFQSKDFDQIDAAFRSRYGKPTVERRVPLSNAFGASYMDEQRVWQFKNLSIMLTKHADANSGGATLEKSEWTNYQAARDKVKREKAAKDL